MHLLMKTDADQNASKFAKVSLLRKVKDITFFFLDIQKFFIKLKLFFKPC